MRAVRRNRDGGVGIYAGKKRVMPSALNGLCCLAKMLPPPPPPNECLLGGAGAYSGTRHRSEERGLMATSKCKRCKHTEQRTEGVNIADEKRLATN